MNMLRSSSILLATILIACGGDDESGQSGVPSGGSAGMGGNATGGGSGGQSDSGGVAGSVGGAGTGAGVGGSSGGAGSGSLLFVENAASDHEYARHTAIPPGFGEGELTLELWITLAQKPVGSCSDSTAGQLTNWCDADNAPYSNGSWWFEGNFLLDGHNNAAFQDGTFSLQFYGGGRVRWLFGDGASTASGGLWSVGAYPASDVPNLLDQSPHLVALVRRFTGATDSTLELWVDGQLQAQESSPVRANMRSFWDAWPGFPTGQEGWFWGAEKQAAIGVLSQYEDFKGNLHEVRFWSIARSAPDLASSPDTNISNSEPGLVGRFDFVEGAGSSTCDSLDASICMTLEGVSFAP